MQETYMWLDPKLVEISWSCAIDISSLRSRLYYSLPPTTKKTLYFIDGASVQPPQNCKDSRPFS